MSDDEFIYDDYEDSDSSDEEPCSSQNPVCSDISTFGNRIGKFKPVAL